MVTRRSFATSLLTLGCGTLASTATFAQPRPRNVGWLSARTAKAGNEVEFQGGFRDGMRQLGYVERRD